MYPVDVHSYTSRQIQYTENLADETPQPTEPKFRIVLGQTRYHSKLATEQMKLAAKFSRRTDQ
jgi:hypothetical protein